MRRRPSSLVLWLNEQMIGAQDPKVGTPERSRRSALSASAKRLKSGEFVKAKIPIQLKSGESTVQLCLAERISQHATEHQVPAITPSMSAAGCLIAVDS